MLDTPLFHCQKPLELPFSFEGFVMWTAKKGKNEFGRETGAEFNFDTMLMWDVGRTLAIAPKKFRLGIEYQSGAISLEILWIKQEQLVVDLRRVHR